MLLLFWNGAGGSSPSTPSTPAATGTESRHKGGTFSGGVKRRYADPDHRRSERDKIAAEFKAIYAELYADATEATAEQLAALVAEYTPTRAPDFPPPAVIDWDGLADDTARLVTFRNAIADIRRQVEAARLQALADDEDETLLLLLN